MKKIDGHNCYLMTVLGLMFLPFVAVWMHLRHPGKILERVIKEDNYFIKLIYAFTPFVLLYEIIKYIID